MALFHFLHNERYVRIGGWQIKCWRWFWHIGGHYYKIEPISVKRWIALYPMLKAFLGEDFKEDIETAFLKTMESVSHKILQPFLVLLVTDAIFEKDLLRANKAQIKAAWKMFCEVNDINYICSWYNKTDEAMNELEISYEDYALFLAERLSGTLLPHDFLNLPVQYFLALFEGFRRIDNIREGIPASAEKLTDKEKEMAQNYFKSLGVMVN